MRCKTEPHQEESVVLSKRDVEAIQRWFQCDTHGLLVDAWPFGPGQEADEFAYKIRMITGVK